MNLRNQELFKRVENHPLRRNLAAALDIAEAYSEDATFVAHNRDLSDEGRSKARKSSLAKALRDLREARRPIEDMRRTIEAKRAAVKRPAFDKTDLAGVLNRQELRAALRAMSQPERMAVLFGSDRDIAFVDALLEQPAVLSGLTLAGDHLLYAQARQERLKDLFGPQIAEIEEMQRSMDEAQAIADVARNDLRQSSGLNEMAFEQVAGPIDSRRNAPWIIRNGDKVQVVDLSKRGTTEMYRPATPDEIADGKSYASEADYLADRAA